MAQLSQDGYIEVSPLRGRHRKALANYPRFSEQVVIISFWFEDKKDIIEEEQWGHAEKIQ